MNFFKNSESEYDDLKRRLEKSIVKDEAQQKAILAKRMEKKAIKKAGGGKELARRILGKKKPSDQLSLQFNKE